jgi:dTDP-4-dehydrorhamnose reductase
MLGSDICRTLDTKHEVIAITRKEFDAEKAMADYACKGGCYFSDFVKSIGKVDYVINALGVTIVHSAKNPALTFFVNSALPHLLAREYGLRLIHITTDCVYSGKGGAPYNEDSHFSPTDLYGLSKSLGEPEESIVIRTSIIGRGGDGTGLLGWFMKQSGIVQGFTDHLWNGITTRQFALVCDRIMMEGVLQCGVSHVFSNSVSKYEMLSVFKKHFDVPCEIIPVSGNPIDRRLSTRRVLNGWLEIPSFEEML